MSWHLARRVPSGGSGNPATRMCPRAAQVQPLDRGAIAAPAGDGTHEQNLVESELTVVEVPLGRAVLQLLLVRRVQLDLAGLRAQDLRDALLQPLTTLHVRR